MNLTLSSFGLATSIAGGLILLFGKRWYWTSAAIPLMVLGLAWTFFGP